MGGRGASSGGMTGRTATQLVDNNGVKIDLTSTPLQYGPKDPYLTQKARSVLDAFESKRRPAKIEYTCFVLDNGYITEQKRGGANSCKVSLSGLNSNAGSHNHPRGPKEAGQLGGTFSWEDFKMWAPHNLRTFRATASEGTYSISN